MSTALEIAVCLLAALVKVVLDVRLAERINKFRRE